MAGFGAAVRFDVDPLKIVGVTRVGLDLGLSG